MQQTVRCPECGWQNPLEQRFCKNCAAGLGTRCPRCFADIPAYSQYCPSCTWKDQHYALQKEKSRTLRKELSRQGPAARKQGQSAEEKPQYICPQCGAIVDANYKNCPECHLLGARHLATSAAQEAESIEPAATPPETVPLKASRVQQEEAGDSSRLQYICPQCGASVDTAYRNCPHCRLLGAKYLATSTTSIVSEPPPSTQSPSGELSHPTISETSIPAPPSPLLDEIATAVEPQEEQVPSQQSPLLSEITTTKTRQWSATRLVKQLLDNLTSAARKAPSARALPKPRAPREWRFPSAARRFLKPALASVLIIALGVSAVMVVTNAIIPALSQHGDETNSSTPSTSTTNPFTISLPSPSQTYTLAASVIPLQAGNVSPKNETFESGIEVTLTASPTNGCYIFDRWGGDISDSSAAVTPGESAEITIAMDSDKHIVAHFKVKDTTPAKISEVEVVNCSDTSATIAWQTDEDAASHVEYDTTDACSEIAESDAGTATSHSARLTCLSPGTKYYFKVKSEDGCENESVSEKKTFTTLAAIPVGYEEGNRAPDFSFSTYQDDNPESPNKGQTIRLSDFQGKKILLDFWSTRCSACLAQFPHIRAVYDNHGRNSGDIAVITVCIDGDRTDRIKILSDKYTDKFGAFNFPILLDKEHVVTDMYNIWRIPKTIFIDSDGIIREIRIGRFDTQQEIEDVIESL